MEESRQQMALSRLKQMVTNFMAQPRCAPFCQPVDWKALGLDDYPEIIPSPMDLGTILQQLNNNNNSQYYTSAHACADHCKLVWNNALRYNLPHSPIWETARLFRRRFNDTWLQIRKDCLDSVNGDQQPLPPSKKRTSQSKRNNKKTESVEQALVDMSDDDADNEGDDVLGKAARRRRARLASQLLNLGSRALCEIIQLLYENCPEAIEHQDSSEKPKLGILVEKITPDTLDLVDTYLTQQIRRESPLKRAPVAAFNTSNRNGRRRRKEERDILQIDAKTGRVIGVFPTFTAAGLAGNDSRQTVSRMLKSDYNGGESRNGWIYQYAPRDGTQNPKVESDGESLDADDSAPPPRKRQRGCVQPVRVAEFNASTGAMIRVFNSISDLAKARGIKNRQVRMLYLGQAPSQDGLVWRRYESNDEEEEEEEEEEDEEEEDDDPATTPASERKPVNSVKVIQYDPVTGEDQHIHFSMSDAARAVGCSFYAVSRVLSGQCTDWKGIAWRRCDESNDQNAWMDELVGDEPESETEPLTEFSNPERPRKNHVQVVRYDPISMKDLEVYDSMTAAAAEIPGCTRHMVRKVILGELPDYNGTVWRRLDVTEQFESECQPIDSNDDLVQEEEVVEEDQNGASHSVKGGVQVIQYDPATGKDIQHYPTMTAAGKAVGCDRKQVRKVLLGQIQHWNGIAWRRPTEQESEEMAESAAPDEQEPVECQERVIREVVAPPPPPHRGVRKHKGGGKPPVPVAECNAETGEILFVYPSIAAASKAADCCPATVSSIVRGKRKEPWNGVVWRRHHESAET